MCYLRILSLGSLFNIQMKDWIYGKFPGHSGRGNIKNVCYMRILSLGSAKFIDLCLIYNKYVWWKVKVMYGEYAIYVLFISVHFHHISPWAWGEYEPIITGHRDGMTSIHQFIEKKNYLMHLKPKILSDLKHLISCPLFSSFYSLPYQGRRLDKDIWAGQQGTSLQVCWREEVIDCVGVNCVC